MNHSFIGRIPPAKLAMLASFNDSSSQYNEPTNYQSQYNGTGPSYHASTSQQNDSRWYADTGASNHLIPDLNNLASHTSYRGADKVLVGNSQGLASGKMFFQGKNENGLYPLHLTSKSPTFKFSHTAFISNKASSSTWHSRLGHPADPILHKLIHTKSIAVQQQSSKVPFVRNSRLFLPLVNLLHLCNCYTLIYGDHPL